MSGLGFLDGFSFESLIAPCDSDVFIRDHWDKAPLHERRGLPDFYDGLLSLADIDRVLAHTSQGGTRSAKGDVDIDAALRRLEQGAALVLDQAQHQLPTLAAVCRTVHATLGFRCHMSVEVTMASNKPHRNEASVEHRFVLQLVGRRNWQLDGPYLGEEFVLEAGDLLYLPPDCPFQHRSTGDEAITAILSVQAQRWLDMAGAGALLDDISAPEDLAEPLPPGWIHTRRDELVAELSRRWRQADDLDSVDAAVAQTIQTEVRAFPLDVAGRLVETMRPRALTNQTVFNARRDLLWAFESNGPVSRLIAGPLTIDMKTDLVDAAQFCLSTPRFKTADVPGPMDDEDRDNLIRVLSRNMLIHIAG